VLGGGPEPGERAVLQPAAPRRLQEPVAQPEQARRLPPARHPRAGRRPVQRQRPHDREPAGRGAHRRERRRGRAGVPARRVDDRGVDPARIHQADGLLGGERRDLPRRPMARQAAAPDGDLGIDDGHRVRSSRGVLRTVRVRECLPDYVQIFAFVSQICCTNLQCLSVAS
jgi:hypothetical protein